MTEKIYLDNLNESNVWVRKEILVDMNGSMKPIDIIRKSYSNSVSGRQQVIEELESVHQNAIFALWGDTPIVIEENI